MLTVINKLTGNKKIIFAARQQVARSEKNPFRLNQTA